jgi:hypothetical protein
MESESILWEGILELQRGERKRAGALLVRYTRMHPDSAEGWLWLSRCLDDPKEVEYCLRKARKLDPALAASFFKQAAGGEISQTPEPEASAVNMGQDARAEEPPRQVSTSPRIRRLLGAVVGLLVLLAAVGGWWLYRDHQAKLRTVAPQITRARLMIENCAAECDYAAGVAALDQVLKIDPAKTEARSLRSLGLLNLALTRSEKEQALDELKRAQADIDRVISASPPNGRDYAARYRVFHALAQRQEYRADAEALLHTAFENLSVAVQIGGSDVQHELPGILFQLGKCDVGFDELDKQARDLPAGQPSAILKEWLSVGLLACGGTFQEALDALNESINEYPDALRPDDTRAFERALILYYQGQPADALFELDELINARPEGSGERYYLRGLILYEQGEDSLAVDDLARGEANTWERGGLNAYLRSLIALDEGRDDEALRLLQEAEASTLQGIYTPMLERYWAELAGLGAEPLQRTPAARFRATPILLDQ